MLGQVLCRSTLLLRFEGRVSPSRPDPSLGRPVGGGVLAAGAGGGRLDGDGREVSGRLEVGAEGGAHVERVEEGHRVEFAWRG